MVIKMYFHLDGFSYLKGENHVTDLGVEGIVLQLELAGELLQVRVFTASALWADSVSKSKCPSVAYLSLPLRKACFPVDWRLLVEEHIANFGIPPDTFGFLLF